MLLFDGTAIDHQDQVAGISIDFKQVDDHIVVADTSARE